MKPLTDKQKKIAWIIALVLVVLHFANPLIMTIRQRLSAPPAPALFQKPAAAASQARAQVAPPSQWAPDPSSKWTGIYLGTVLSPNQDSCQMRLEIRNSDEKPGNYAGYLTRRCIPASPLMGGKITQQKIPDILKDTNPISGIFSGPVVDGTLELHLDKSVGTAPDGCELTDYEISPFGQLQMAAQWKAGSKCPAGQILLSKARG